MTAAEALGYATGQLLSTVKSLKDYTDGGHTPDASVSVASDWAQVVLALRAVAL